MRVYYALIDWKPDLMVYGNWLNLVELINTFDCAYMLVSCYL
jgi:hypothetical protein